jgi:hypothetical protein
MKHFIMIILLINSACGKKSDNTPATFDSPSALYSELADRHFQAIIHNTDLSVTQTDFTLSSNNTATYTVIYNGNNSLTIPITITLSLNILAYTKTDSDTLTLTSTIYQCLANSINCYNAHNQNEFKFTISILPNAHDISFLTTDNNLILTEVE